MGNDDLESLEPPLAPPPPPVRTLPENAHRELRPGERYVPVIGAAERVPEVTGRSVSFGLLMSFLFSGAAAYIALKLGQGIETAIPIAILAIGWSAAASRKSTLIENVNILAFGATSGIVVGGSIFVMPAIYILHLEDQSSFFQLAVVPFLGAVLGVLYLVPFRRYFVAEMHGKLPFPEGTATTEVLMTGETGGAQARTLLYSMGIGAIFDFVGPAMRAWREEFTTALVPVLDKVALKVKLVFTLNTTAAVLGLGYLIGVRYAAFIMAGSVLSFLVLVPLFPYIGGYLGSVPPQGIASFSDLDHETLFYDYVRYIGIGGIFAAGVVSIFKMRGVIRTALGQVLAQVKKMGGRAEATESVRTDSDIALPVVVAGIVAIGLFLFVYFRFALLSSFEGATYLALLAVLIAMLVSFLFAAVSAWAVAMISVTPISGMTLTTLIISSFLLVNLGLHGDKGMVATLLIGGVVCTALSMTGSLVTQFKIGYWLGSTPKTIQWSNILGSVVAAVTTTGVMMLLAHVYGFRADPTHPDPLPAPQPNAMADVVKGIMGGGEAPWALYGVGAVLAIIVELLGISGLAFALGMYLPMSLNSPILIGAIVAWLVQRSSKDAAVAKARNDRGILISSGLIAGGALIGVLAALVRFYEDTAAGAATSAAELVPASGLWGSMQRLAREVYFSIGGLWDFGNDGAAGNYLGLGVFALLCVYLYLDSRRGRPQA